MSTIISGDSNDVELLVSAVGRSNVDFVASSSRANQELDTALLRHRTLSSPSAVANLFATRPASAEVPFLPRDRLLTSHEKAAAVGAFAAVVETGEFTSGPHVEEWEAELADFLHVPIAIGVSSGTDGLITALRAVGIGHGDEVIVPANSFAATENAILACGAVPVLCDVDSDTGTLDPEAVTAALTPRSGAILPVHLFGRLTDMLKLRNIADNYGLAIVEDACQALGVTGVGVHSDAAVISFNPYKNFGLCGKAGAIITRHKDIGEKCRRLSYHGFAVGQKNLKVETYGLNARMDNVDAAIALALLPSLALRSFKRAFLARRYTLALATLAEIGALELCIKAVNTSWHLYPIRVSDNYNRDEVRHSMWQLYHVETDIYYPVLTHQQPTPTCDSLFGGAKLPATERFNRQSVCLPLHNGLSLAEQDQVIEAVHGIFA